MRAYLRLRALDEAHVLRLEQKQEDTRRKCAQAKKGKGAQSQGEVNAKNKSKELRVQLRRNARATETECAYYCTPPP
eukprot:178194-Pleurochrysis_carterae.AAC.2